MDHAPYVKIKNRKVSELNDGTRQYENYPEKIGQLKTIQELILKGFEGDQDTLVFQVQLSYWELNLKN